MERLNKSDSWYVIYNNSKVVEVFHHSWTARSFVSSNKKYYFDDLQVLSKKEWEEMKNVSRRNN